MSKTGFSVLSFDAVTDSENAQPLTLIDPEGNETPLTVMVIGDNADAPSKRSAKILRDMRAAEDIARRSGKPVPLDLDKLKEDNVESAAVRVVGWSGVDEAFEKDLLKKCLRRNPHFVSQIIEFSGNLANFTKKA